MTGTNGDTSSTVMGPGASELRIGRMPPAWDGVSKPFRLYQEELLNWLDFTSLPAERHAPAVILSLSGEPQRLALTISRDDRKKADGLNKIIQKFEEVYSSTDEQDLYYYYKQLTSFRRTDAHTIQDFISGFTSRAEKLKACKDIIIPPKLLSMMMIDYANLSKEQENNLFGASGGDLDFVKVSRALKLVMKDVNSTNETASSAPLYVSSDANTEKTVKKKFCRYCKKRGHIMDECWRLKRRNQNFKKSGGENSRRNWKFPVFANTESFLLNPIIDSAAGISVIGTETLNDYRKLLHLTELETAEPIEATHRFGYYGKPIETLYSAFIPLPIESHDVLIHADVLPGFHPFLIGQMTQERMQAVLRYGERTFSFKLGKEEVTINLIKPDQHLLIPMKGNDAIYLTRRNRGEIDFKKLHTNTGHSSFENMKKLLKHANKWHDSYKEPIESVISECEPCLKTGKPKLAPVVDIRHIDPIFNAEAEIDIVYFHGKPFLHTECKKTKLSATIQLESREATDLWNAFVYSWIFSTAHCPPIVLQGDPEFNNSVFKEGAERWGITLKGTAAKAKWQQGIVERGNGILRAIFNRINAENPGIPLHMKVAQATFAKNIMFGAKNASSYELVYHRTFPVGGYYASLPKCLHDSYTRSVARRKIGTALKARSRKFSKFIKNEYIYFFREHLGGFVGPAKVIEFERDGNMIVYYRGRKYSISKDMVRKIHQTLEYWIDEQPPADEQPPEQSSEKLVSSGFRLRLHNYRPGDHRPESEVAKNLPNDIAKSDPSSAHTHSSPQGPAAGTRSRKKGSEDFRELSFLSDLKVFYAEDGMASDQEIQEAFTNEYLSWKEQGVFTKVPISAVPEGSNIIASHVVYRWKHQGTPKQFLKARIVPHGNKDHERGLLRVDSPSLKPEVLRLLCSFAIDMGYPVRRMDIKTAFLQTGPLEREIFVIPPKEAKDSEFYWKLLITVYGLVDGPLKWHKHSRTVLMRYGLSPSRIDPTIYYLTADSNEPHRLVVATQVDDFLYCGPEKELLNFEQYIVKQYKIGDISMGNYIFNGVEILCDDGNKCITLSQKNAKVTEPIALTRSRGKGILDVATNTEKNHYRSIIGSLLWIGTQTIPHLQYLSSSMARKTEHLQLQHLKQANNNVKYAACFEAKIRINRSKIEKARILVFTDASHGSEGGIHSQEGAILFKFDADSNALTPLMWSSRKIRRVVKSTLAAETIAAVNGYDDGVYIQQLLCEFYKTTFPLDLYTDSKSLYDLLSSTHLVETTEKRLKIDIAAIRQAFESGELSSISWIPRKLQLADSLTKLNREAAELLQRTLNEGKLLINLSDRKTRKST